MKITLNIEGMMCVRCEARVKKALEGIDGVKEAVVSYKDGSAIVEYDAPAAPEAMKAAVEEKGYTLV